MQHVPLIIVGAPRSGTNMLRDVLTRLPGIATWPCDEINLVWRHGNLDYPSDEFPAELARPPVQRYIRRQFDWVQRRFGARIVVEKTCANSLRIPFVARVVPDARFIVIRRDGVDAVGSALKRWDAPVDIPYLARKARFVPPSDLPYHIARYVWGNVRRLSGSRTYPRLWGPIFEGMADQLVERPLEEVCAMQWRQCVRAAQLALSEMDPSVWTEVRYEKFVCEPEAELKRLIGWLGFEEDERVCRGAVAPVRSDSIGKGRAWLNPRTVRRVEEVIDGRAK